MTCSDTASAASVPSGKVSVGDKMYGLSAATSYKPAYEGNGLSYYLSASVRFMFDEYVVEHVTGSRFVTTRCDRLYGQVIEIHHETDRHVWPSKRELISNEIGRRLAVSHAYGEDAFRLNQEIFWLNRAVSTDDGFAQLIAQTFEYKKSKEEVGDDVNECVRALSAAMGM